VPVRVQRRILQQFDIGPQQVMQGPSKHSLGPIGIVSGHLPHGRQELIPV
jgi:hypothetical protein